MYLLPEPDKNMPTLEDIMRKVRKIKVNSALDFLFFDYDQLITTEKWFESEERRVSYIAGQLKLLRVASFNFLYEISFGCLT